MKKKFKNLQGWVLSYVWLSATLWTITLQDPLVYEISQARTAIWPSNPTSGHIHQGNQIWKRHVHPRVWIFLNLHRRNKNVKSTSCVLNPNMHDFWGPTTPTWKLTQLVPNRRLAWRVLSRNKCSYSGWSSQPKQQDPPRKRGSCKTGLTV